MQAGCSGSDAELAYEPDSVDISLEDEPVELQHSQQGRETDRVGEEEQLSAVSEHEVALMMDVLMAQLQAELALMVSLKRRAIN